ncbi:DUF3168 domain-containing protein [Actinocatenispora sera]|uniref:DUF3168 domain-containing protein n=1 Tax=Actinocatenispora sera TaxID=390989 RepID=UPI0033D902F7
MTAALGAVQTAVYARLAGDVTLAAMAPVYDEVPEGTAYPYVTISGLDATPDNALGELGSSVNITLNVWSKYRGYAQAQRIAARVDALLDHQPLSVAGYRDVSVLQQALRAVRDPNPEIRRVVAEYQVWLTQEG